MLPVLRPRSSRRLRLPSVIVLGLAITAAAPLTSCNATPYAATVNGVVISMSTVSALVSATQAKPAAGPAAATPSTQAGTVTTATAANELQVAILDQLFVQLLARNHVSVTPFARTVATSTLTAQSAGRAIPAGQMRPLVNLEAEQLALEAVYAKQPLTREAFQSYATSNPQVATVAELRYVALPSSDLASAVAGAARGGATLAAAYSQVLSSAGGNGASPTVPQSAQQPQAAPLMQLPPAMRQAVVATPTGGIGGPVAVTQTGSGGQVAYVVFQLLASRVVPFDAAVPLIAAAVLQPGLRAVSSAFDAFLHASRIDVNPAVGTFSLTSTGSSPFTITPPGAPDPRLLPGGGTAPSGAAGTPSGQAP